MKYKVNPYIPADESDARHLAENRARVWPSVFVTILIIAAVIVACGYAFGPIPTLIGVIAVCIIGLVALVVFGGLNNAPEEDVEEFKNTLPGHDLIKPEDLRMCGGKSYTFDCAPSDLYPYLAQMNLTKGGFYSFQHLERFFSFHIRNDYTIRPEWQRLECGDWMYYHQNGAGTGIVDFKQNEYILTFSDTRFKPTQDLAVAWRPKWMKGFAWTWHFYLDPIDGGNKTRFRTCSHVWWPKEQGTLTTLRLLLQWGLPSNFMMNGMANKMRKLAEADARARRAGKPRPGYNYTK